MIRKPSGQFEVLKDKHGFVIGGMAGSKYNQYERDLEPGSKLFLYSDGVPEAMGGETGEEMFGLDRTLETLNAHSGETPEGLIKALRNSMESFVGETEQFDDITMLCIEYKGQ